MSIKMFKAAILTDIKKIEFHNFPVPNKLRDDQVLVKIKYSGICGSQIMEFLGNRGKDNYLPHAFGHEAVGQVIDIGKKVKKVSPKDEVILSWIKGKGLDHGGFELTNINNQIDFFEHTSGLYYVRFFTNKGMITKKIIVTN